MIFKGHLELIDIAKYRDRAVKRKLELIPDFKTIGQYEFGFLECYERLKELFPGFPYVMFNEFDNNYDYESTRVYSSITDGFYTINYSRGDIGEFRRYTNLIFGKPWDECRISREEREGNTYKPYSPSVYSFTYFKKFDICRVEVERYINDTSIWFKTLHEYAHIINGHLAYKIAMLNHEEEYDVDLLRAMELHADITAVSYMLQIMNQWKKYIGQKQIVKQLNGKDPGISFCDDVVFAAISAYLALRAHLTNSKWDEFTVGIHELKQEEHPLTELRMLVVFNSFLYGIREYGKEHNDEEGFMKTLYIAINQLEDFFYDNCANEEIKELYRPTDLLRTQKGKEYYHKMFEKVLSLNNILKDYETVKNTVDGEWIDYETLPEMDFRE